MRNAIRPSAILLVIVSFAFVISDAAGPRAAAERPAISVSPPFVGRAIAFAVSQPVANFRPPKAERSAKLGLREIGGHSFRESTIAARSTTSQPASQLGSAMPQPLLSFDGLPNFDNLNSFGVLILPPDMNGDVGPRHYVQTVNALTRIYDKGGLPLTPPFKLSSLFAPLNTACALRDDGLAVVQYDQLADRWLISQYCNNFPPFRQLVALSKTGDPTGKYYLWEFVMPNNRINDFAKFGVWPDGYYMSDEEFTGSDFSAAGIFAFDRTRMLKGEPNPIYIYFNVPSSTPERRRNMLPSDLDGLRPPAAGTPNVFVSYTADEYGDSADAVRLFDFHADFGRPTMSTFTERPESPLVVAPFDPTSPPFRADIRQPAPGDFLDSNSDRVNYRAAYRNLGDRQSIVVNQTVRTSASGEYRAGVRVHELSNTGTAFTVRDSSTIGDATSSRWVGSAAQDGQGNLAVSYNYVRDDKQPSIRYTGRLASEPVGAFRSEATLIDGTGVQRAFGYRWGDFNSINVDPNDDCTFWTTGEYYTLASQEFSEFTWLTRIGTFRFPECTSPPKGTISGTVTNAVTGLPIEDAIITAGVYSRATDASGAYSGFSLPPGSFALTATAHGYVPGNAKVVVDNGENETVNFTLEPVPLLEDVAFAIDTESCGTNSAPDPGENITATLSLRNTGSIATGQVSVTLANTGGVTNAGVPVDFGVLAPGAPPVTRQFTFTVDPNLPCGGLLGLTFQITDSSGTFAESMGRVMRVGAPRAVFSETFDRTPLAGLPQRWSRETVDLAGRSSVTLRHSSSGPKSVYLPDSIGSGITTLTTPAFLVSGSSAKLTFRHYYNLETTFLRNRLYDGTVLEIKIGDADWVDFLTAGGAFQTGGYDGAIDACCMNPLAGRLGWSGRSGINEMPEWITVNATLPASTAGNRVQLRWRLGTDIGNSRVVEGDFIDDLVVSDGYTCGCSGQLARP
ncbi:MAG: hypothetical protein UZ17_ACD001001664 [Acidobacteria bacterium OLB17]|nr:MAG: hypothetical protein UZ17_ACD001001664 [Acidobacteria bacterium OLB17]MCZ2390742.1 carboxypeptidase regulatory-like domain-containing protein [Acidobacteriota bacterium]